MTDGDGGANGQDSVETDVACPPLLVLSTAPKYDGTGWWAGVIMTSGSDGDVGVRAGVLYVMSVALWLMAAMWQGEHQEEQQEGCRLLGCIGVPRRQEQMAMLSFRDNNAPWQAQVPRQGLLYIVAFFQTLLHVVVCVQP